MPRIAVYAFSTTRVLIVLYLGLNLTSAVQIGLKMLDTLTERVLKYMQSINQQGKIMNKLIDTVLVPKFQSACYQKTQSENMVLVNAVRAFTHDCKHASNSELAQINRSLDIAPEFVISAYGVK